MVGIILVAFIAFVIILPMFFKGKIAEIAKYEANNILNAQFDFSDLSISMLSSFPFASIDISDVSVVGVAPFEGDTLLFAKKIKAAIDIKSLFGDKGIAIKEILIEEPYVNGIVADSVNSNWDIIKKQNETEETVDVNKPSNFSLHLESFIIKDGRINYINIPSDIKGFATDLNVKISGDMTADTTTLQSESIIKSLTYIKGNIPYLSSAMISLKADIGANFKESMFTFENNNLAINAINTSLNGWVSMPEDDVIDMNLRLNTSKVNFKDILSLIPVIYTKEFDGLKADGTVLLNAWAKGNMSGDTLPAFETSLNVEGGMFKYASLPESVNNINLSAKVYSAGGDINNVKAEIEYLDFIMGGNSFKLLASASEFAGDMKFNIAADGKIDLNKISQIYPLSDSVTLSGVITADASISGRMSQIEKEEYDKISAKGDIKIEGLKLKRNATTDILISQALLQFTPEYILLKTFDAKIGESDVHVDGKLENLIAYIMRGATVKGNINVSSDYMNVNQFLTEDKQAETVPNDSVASHDTVKSSNIVTVPENIDFQMTLDMKKIHFDKMDLTNLKGKATVKSAIAKLNGLTFSAFDGMVTVNGSYDTSVEAKPVADMHFSVKNASFKSTFKSVETLQKLAPVFENMTGNYTMSLSVKTDIGKELTPDLNTIAGSGVIKSNDVTISGVTALDKLADAINYQALKKISPNDMDISFTIKDGKITTKPFDLQMGSNKLVLEGSTGMDQSIDYSGIVTLDKGITLGGISINNIPLQITGTFSSPKVSIDTKSAAADVLNDLGKQALENAGISNESKEEVKEIVKEKAGNAIKEAAKKLFK